MGQQRPLYDIGPFRSSTKNTNTQLNVYVSNKHFKVDLYASNFESSPALLEEYLRQVKRQEPEYIYPTRQTKMMNQSRKYTLENCLFAEELHYTVRAVEGELVPDFLRNTKRKKIHLIGARLPSSTHVDYPMFPVYDPSEVQVPIDADSTSLPAVPRKMFISGRPQPSFFKRVYAGDAGITLKELFAYSNIHAARFDLTIRTSRLDGLVQDSEGYVMGLLLSYIDFRCIDGRNPRYSELRQTWVDQISHTLKNLHSHRIVWRDAKAANVLIDANEDAYLIDFGGGYTEGWVDKENSNSIDGDI